MKPLTKDSKIGFAIHTYGPIEPKVYFNHLGVLMRWARKYDMAFIGIDRFRVADARNILVDTAISLGCTHMLIVDADHIVPDHMLECLSLNNEASISSGLVCKRKPPYPQIGFGLVEGEYHLVDLPIDGRSYLVDVPAMGCTLIDMDVFKHLNKPYFKDTLERGSNGKPYNKRSDINFFEAVKAAGFKSVIDTRVLIGHVGEPQAVYPNTVPDARELNRKSGIRRWEDSLRWQDEVYKIAGEHARKYNFKTVLDLGCGNPAKLDKHLGCVNSIVGIDFPEKIMDIAAVGSRLPSGIKTLWRGHDLNTDFDMERKFDLVIIADVIEHVEEPEVLLTSARKHMTKDSLLIVSSPEKRTISGDNGLHVQEFTYEELLGVLSANGLSIIRFSDYKETSITPNYTNNVFVCKVKES